MSRDSNDSDNACSLQVASMALVVPPESPKRLVKSTAIVKYSITQTPASYAQLQCNTDLNLPPSNWLSNSAESYGLQNVWSQSTGFSSFRMAHMFPDCVGEVDVVSDAENIKKLLKLPYHQGMISMMVHRIENTILLDDFDIHKYLLRQAENDWEWLKKFFYEHICQNLSDKEKRLFHKAFSRNSLQQKNLVSKFLYHSIVFTDGKEQNKRPQLPVKTSGPCLPEPTQEEKVPDPNYNHNFARNVVWTFEDIQMLIGTDMPIFGGQTHPCISLRLRDMSKPINVLTGIDYWLDNLMCNVPEVVMCYHLDGIVQKYELIKTEDLPNMDNSKFSPKVIRDVAQNILSFLKNNATKAGHTYWLFKGKDDDVVKLYDLTSLCNISEEKGQNPFTVPVAMLLYRVARNMNYSSLRLPYGTIRMLLENCIPLLDKEKYPQIVTSAHVLLSDLYIPSTTNPADPKFPTHTNQENTNSECGTYQKSERKDDEEEDEEEDDEEDDDEEEEEEATAINSLTLANMQEHPERQRPKYKPPPIRGTVKERCLSGLEHVVSGLECLRYFPTKDSTDDQQKETREAEKEKRDYEETHPNVAKPFQAIPMPYAPLHNHENTAVVSQKASENYNPTSKVKKKEKKKNDTKSEELASKNSLLYKPEVKPLPTWQTAEKSNSVSWRSHLKALLFEKASLIFAVLAENEYIDKNYGASLRYTLKALQCHKFLEIFRGVKNVRSFSFSLGRAGDCCFMIVQDWRNVKRHTEDYEIKNEMEEKVVQEIFKTKNINTDDIECIPNRFESIESTLNASHECYFKALSLESVEVDRKNLMRRLGNIHNELGVFYMNKAGSASQLEQDMQDPDKTDESSDSQDISMVLSLSLKNLKCGIKAFEAVHDKANLALLHSNTGRYMRLCAHLNKNNVQERHYYCKAFASYEKAFRILGSKETNPEIWGAVKWDYSTTLFLFATILQDCSIKGKRSQDDVEKELIDILQKTLKSCDLDTPGPRQPVYQYRAATIQHRLASLYHSLYRQCDVKTDSGRRKTYLQLCKLYYNKSTKLYLQLETCGDYLTVQMELIALAEYQAAQNVHLQGKIKAYQGALDLLLQTITAMELLHERCCATVRKNEEVRNNKAMKLNKDKNEEKESEKEVEDVDENENKEQEVLLFDGLAEVVDEDEAKILLLFERRLQVVLQSLTKLLLPKNIDLIKAEHVMLGNLYKKCYARALRPTVKSGYTLVKHLMEVLRDLNFTLKPSDF